MTVKKKRDTFNVGLDATGAYDKYWQNGTSPDLTISTNDTVTFTQNAGGRTRLTAKDSSGATTDIPISNTTGSWTPSASGDYEISDDLGQKILGKIRVSSPNPTGEASRPASPGSGRRPPARRR